MTTQVLLRVPYSSEKYQTRTRVVNDVVQGRRRSRYAQVVGYIRNSRSSSPRCSPRS
jgi:hypothetical protein